MFDRISATFQDIVRSITGKATISPKNIEEAVEQIKYALLEADVHVRVVRRFVNQTIQEATGERVLKSVTPGQQFVKILYDKLVSFLGDERQDLTLKGPDTLSIILLAGLQGSGKTTTAAKLALHLKKKGRRPLLVAADLARPAAIDQLETLGASIDVPVYTDRSQKDPRAVVKRALSHAKRQAVDTLIVDTAGRHQVDRELMDELSRLVRDLSPDEALLVADAMTGQTAVDVAKAFNEAVGITGVVLTKFDSDTRGGAALSIRTITGAPIKFIGVGEKVDDLEPFYPDRIASRILGMGDVVTLVEKARELTEAEEAEKLQEKIKKATFTLEDYLEQFQKIKKMGSLQKLAELVPGMEAALGGQEIDEKAIRREEAIILSMTPAERRNPRIIGPSRKKRIARGSGTSVYEVNRLLKNFEKTRLMMKKMLKQKGMQQSMPTSWMS
ncbi:signal recognition particle protein [Spirochaeta thermophila DSM 6578]|uniref:Signal recognition particle protein n=1 Tax=Winmispira thermophila (strain ATCC 700085 / DSM 6578 / Z-1203) TaxID=869211 RepID=G0GDK3_WINT7|nr:signal recognition particle protein [Spirochaeta thermophila]AEJ61350.1 signal recognition particle protein [Spirochaeta thermophila DSM 6578]